MSEREEETLGMAIRKAREARGWTLQRLADAVGCAKSYISVIENDLRAAPGDEILENLEAALGVSGGRLLAIARWQRSLQVGGPQVRRDVSRLQETRIAAERLAELLRQAGGGKAGIDALYASGELRRLVEQISPGGAMEGEMGKEDARGTRAGVGEPSRRRDAGGDAGANPGGSSEGGPAVGPIGLPLSWEVPLINRVAAGYPTDFSDLGYPARIADEYVRSPDMDHDPDAFAARVVGDSMMPRYQEGDIVIFSPRRVIKDGSDCFVRLEPDHESTFKRVYFEKDEAGGEYIRLQPLNSAYPPRVVAREGVAGLYAAVSVMRRIE